jgi:adenylosuccinate synthase
VTKLDVLTGLEKLKICVAYELDGHLIRHMPASLARLARCRAVYVELPGWSHDISSARSVEELPGETRAYLNTIEEESDVPISIVSVGPSREATIQVRKI